MQNNLAKLVITGAIIGLFLGIIGNIFGSGALDYKATYNIGFWGDDTRINKNLEENPSIPPYEKQNTVVGGAIFGIILGALIGLITALVNSEGAYVLSAVSGFLLSGFILSPYPFYLMGMYKAFIPPVSYQATIWVLIPGIIVSVLISMFLERFKTAEAEIIEVPVNQPQAGQQQQQGKKKKK